MAFDPAQRRISHAKMLEAFGSPMTEVAASKGKSPQEPGQKALRVALLGAESLRQEMSEQKAAAIETLRREWAAGSMPAARQEAIVHGAVSGAGNSQRQALAELAAEIGSSPRSLVDWTGAGWSFKPLPKDDARAFGPDACEWLALGPREAEPLLRQWALRVRKAEKSGDAERVERLGLLRPPVERLGDDPVRALLAAAAPDEQDSPRLWLAPFKALMAQFGAESLQAYPLGRPTLLAAIDMLGVSARASEREEWLQEIAGADTQPWLRHRFGEAGWSGAHPLWELARHLARGQFSADASVAAIEAVVRAGFGADGSLPAGQDGLRAVSPSRTVHCPNPLWAAIDDAEWASDALPAIFDALTRAGADWRELGGANDPGRCRALIARVTEKADGAQKEKWEPLFERLVSLGADPDDALPAPTLLDAPSGRIRDTIAARREQIALIDGLSRADIEEALALLAEKRALQAAAKAAAAAPGSGPQSEEPGKSRPRGARL
jgi:hypothetical protein